MAIWDEIEKFMPSEFACPCCGRIEMDSEFLQMLENARVIANIPFIVTSGFRCEEYNAEVGGVSSSSHVEGYAADIKCEGSRSRYRIVSAAFEAGFNRIGIAKEFIHLDCDPAKPENVVWVY